MRSLEIRRHSLRKTGAGSQLSQEGVDLARRLGATMGPFACVVTSLRPRSRETALAMGFAVDFELVSLQPSDDAFAEMEACHWWEQTTPFAALADLLAQQGATARYGEAMAALWRDLILQVPSGAAALLIGHSGDLEIALTACFPQADHAAWGALFAPCEGARLRFDGILERFTSVEFLRGPF